jgi:hypothetical protein
MAHGASETRALAQVHPGRGLLLLLHEARCHGLPVAHAAVREGFASAHHHSALASAIPKGNRRQLRVTGRFEGCSRAKSRLSRNNFKADAQRVGPKEGRSHLIGTTFPTARLN